MANPSNIRERRSARGSPGQQPIRGAGKHASPSAAEVWRKINDTCVSNGEIRPVNHNMLEYFGPESVARKRALQSMHRSGSAATEVMPDGLKVPH